jgi:hypothetical protein
MLFRWFCVNGSAYAHKAFFGQISPLNVQIVSKIVQILCLCKFILFASVPVDAGDGESELNKPEF